MSKFATYYSENTPRICLDIPEGSFEISCRTPNKQQITFSFCPTPAGDGHHCVDVQHHNRADQDVIAFTKELSVRLGGARNEVPTYEDLLETEGGSSVVVDGDGVVKVATARLEMLGIHGRSIHGRSDDEGLEVEGSPGQLVGRVDIHDIMFVCIVLDRLDRSDDSTTEEEA